jgi:hypothetical protein
VIGRLALFSPRAFLSSTRRSLDSIRTFAVLLGLDGRMRAGIRFSSIRTVAVLQR